VLAPPDTRKWMPGKGLKVCVVEPRTGYTAGRPSSVQKTQEKKGLRRSRKSITPKKIRRHKSHDSTTKMKRLGLPLMPAAYPSIPSTAG